MVRFDIRDKTPEGVTDEKFFFKVARGAFSQRRKTLSNSVSSSMGIDKSIVNQAIEQSGLPASVRPEALSMEQFITFPKPLESLSNCRGVAQFLQDVPFFGYLKLKIITQTLIVFFKRCMGVALRSVRKFGQYFNFKPILRHLSLDSPAKCNYYILET